MLCYIKRFECSGGVWKRYIRASPINIKKNIPPKHWTGNEWKIPNSANNQRDFKNTGELLIKSTFLKMQKKKSGSLEARNEERFKTFAQYCNS